MTEKDHKRYADAAHAMQSGVAFEIQLKGLAGAGADPKHLRTGINSAMSDQGALAKLLIAKGIFTEEEYVQAVIKGMEAEKKRYEGILSDHTGKDVSLG